MADDYDDNPDCAEAVHTLYQFLDGELNAGRRTEIQRHLEACLPCFQAYDFEAELRMVVARKCRDQAPPSLQHRVLDAMRQMSHPEGGIPNL